jgi:hypothetical protein
LPYGSQDNPPDGVREANFPETIAAGRFFQDELRALLRKHEIEWDEKYVWD